HREEDATLLERFDVFLKCFVGFAARGSIADFDSFDAVVANDSAPKGVIQITNQHFFGSAPRGSNRERQLPGQLANQARRAYLLGLKPSAVIGGLQRPDARD